MQVLLKGAFELAQQEKGLWDQLGVKKLDLEINWPL